MPSIKLGSAPHHHWSWICSLYNFRVIRCVQFCLISRYMLNGCWCINHFGCGHSLHVARSPLLHFRVCAQHSHSTKKDSCTNIYVGVNWAAHIYRNTWRYSELLYFMGDKDMTIPCTFAHLVSCSKLLAPSKILHNFLHPARLLTLANLAQSGTSAMVTLQ